MISRREFMQALARLAPVLGGSGLILSEPALLRTLPDILDGAAFAGERTDELIRAAPRARFWSAVAKGRVQCHLCARGCLLAEGERGQCRSRMNAGGEMKSLVYGRPVSVHVDPIEKKPFYHFMPGSQAYSIGTTGCPLRCKFCQNWQTSQASPEDYRVRFTPPGDIVETVRSRKAPVIAYTYNEPLVFTEYLLDIASAARLRGIRSVMVTCGFMAEAPLAEMCKALDAVKVDLKGYSESFYRDACGAELKPVLRTIKQIAKSRVHLEIVNLVVPTLNDSDTDDRRPLRLGHGGAGPRRPPSLLTIPTGLPDASPAAHTHGNARAGPVDRHGPRDPLRIRRATCPGTRATTRSARPAKKR